MRQPTTADTHTPLLALATDYLLFLLQVDFASIEEFLWAT